MNSTEIVNAILASRTASSAAHQRVLPEAKALEAKSVRVINLEAPTCVSRVLAAAPGIWALHEEIRRETPSIPLAPLQKLETYANALQEAHVRCLSSKDSPDELKALAEEGDMLRDQLRNDAVPLVSRGIVDGARLESCKGDNSYKGIATELGILAVVLLEHLPRLQGKCAITEAELQRAKAIAEALLAYVGRRELSPEATAEAIDLRNRMFTLLFDNYDIACRAICFLRWPHGDADKIAPSLYPERRRSRKEGEQPEDAQPGTTTPAVTGPVNGTTPVVAPVNTNAAVTENVVGRPNSNPFMS